MLILPFPSFHVCFHQGHFFHKPHQFPYILSKFSSNSLMCCILSFTHHNHHIAVTGCNLMASNVYSSFSILSAEKLKHATVYLRNGLQTEYNCIVMMDGLLIIEIILSVAQIRHAAADVLRECWLLHRTTQTKDNSGEHRHHQRCLLEAIRV